MNFPSVEAQLALIRRGVDKIVPEDELAAKLQKSQETGIPLRIKYGIDPTGIDVHLGHTVPLRKMRQFQELGHQAVIIIGNYTALVGDPSGRDQTRVRLTQEAVERNAQDYLQQVGKVIDLSRAEVVRNGDWFGKMRFTDVLELCSKVTVAQLLTRDDFAKRYSASQPISLHECLYPVMQAWDSVEVRADIELGGTEQLYSFMLARDLQRDQSMSQQIAVMSPILVGTDGTRRMGKSLGNYIGIGESAYEMMKKFMQIPDANLAMYYELLTNSDLEGAKRLIADDPKQAKIELAKLIMTEYHDSKLAGEASERWEREISQKGLPSEIEERIVSCDLMGRSVNLIDLLHKHLKLVSTTSEARRLIGQGGVWIRDRDNRVDDLKAEIQISEGMVLGAGKKKIVRIMSG